MVYPENSHSNLQRIRTGRQVAMLCTLSNKNKEVWDSGSGCNSGLLYHYRRWEREKETGQVRMQQSFYIRNPSTLDAFLAMGGSENWEVEYEDNS